MYHKPGINIHRKHERVIKWHLDVLLYVPKLRFSCKAPTTFVESTDSLEYPLGMSEHMLYRPKVLISDRVVLVIVQNQAAWYGCLNARPRRIVRVNYVRLEIMR